MFPGVFACFKEGLQEKKLEDILSKVDDELSRLLTTAIEVHKDRDGQNSARLLSTLKNHLWTLHVYTLAKYPHAAADRQAILAEALSYPLEGTPLHAALKGLHGRHTDKKGVPKAPRWPFRNPNSVTGK